MANNRTMTDVLSVGVEEDGGIELSLGLSIGGSLSKSKPIKGKESNSCGNINSEATNAAAEVIHIDGGFSRSSSSPALAGDSEPDSGTKREIHALRRLEARKRREEKLRKGLSRGVNGGFAVANGFADDKVRLRERVRERENGGVVVEQRACKKGKGEDCVPNGETKTLNLSLSQNAASDQSGGHGLNPPPAYASPPPIPAPMPLQFAFPQLQQFPFTNGFVYPYLMPCWAPNAGGIGGETTDQNDSQPVACRSFRPYQRNQNSGGGLPPDSDRSTRVAGNGKAVSHGSLVRSSSSVVSDNQSQSGQGGSSSDSGSYSCQSQLEHHQPNGSVSSSPHGPPEHSASSKQIEATQCIGETADCTGKVASSNITQSIPLEPKGKPNSESQPGPVNQPISTSDNPTSLPPKGTSGDSKPPKPQTPTWKNPKPIPPNGSSGELSKSPKPLAPPSLLQMPCVSTTGNGPNGKTITGFLYRYTKTEVSIVCVCHGSSFTPAEFVKHAGGEDVLHPLKHITVIPSAFG